MDMFIVTIRYYFYSLPMRIWRLVLSPFALLGNLIWLRPKYLQGVVFSLLEVILLIGDLIGIPELYDLLGYYLKPSNSRLSSFHKALAKNILEDSVPAEIIKIDDQAGYFAKKGRFAYVSFFTINLYGDISPSVFVHELIHIWQYTRYGSPYIIHALAAQRTTEAYDYGGKEGLLKFYEEGKHIEDLNFEQIGDVLADYYEMSVRLSESNRMTNIYWPIYKHYVDEIKAKPILRWNAWH